MPDPNNIILPGYKFAFMGIPKNANSSIKHALMSALGIPSNKNEHDPRLFLYTNKQWIYQHKREWLIFAVVRNPLDRIISCWRQKVMGPEGLHLGFLKYRDISWKQPFPEFVNTIASIPDWRSDQHWRSQTESLFYLGNPVYNHRIKFESLSTERPVAVKKIQDFCGLSLPDNLLVKNKTRSSIPMPRFNEAVADVIRQRYFMDFSLLGYSDDLQESK